MSDLNYKILMSGSSGNCVVIEDVMFDLGGINIKHFPELLQLNNIDMNNINFLTHSHAHSDHYNPSLDWKLYQQYPQLDFVVRKSMYERLWSDMNITKRHKHLDTVEHLQQRILKMPDVWQSNKLIIKAFDLPHGDTRSTGYVGYSKETKSTFFFGTDFDSISVLPHLKHIDHVFIEANHEANWMGKLFGKGVIPTEWVVESTSRHLSIEDSKTYANMISSSDPDIHYLHKSSRFFDIDNLNVDDLIRTGQAVPIEKYQN